MVENVHASGGDIWAQKMGQRLKIKGERGDVLS